MGRRATYGLRSSTLATATLALLAAFGPACGSKTGLLIPDSGPDAGWDSGLLPDPMGCPPGEPVDVLFVVDNSRSMVEEQASLAAGMPALMEALVVPPDLDGDGTADWNPVTNLHVGVINTDLGVFGFDVGSCERPIGGDGILRNVGDPSSFECLRRYPRFLTYRGGSSEDVVRDLGCIISVGSDGCGHEQPLEAALKALTPSSSDIRFQRGTGHGDGVNEGFLRPDSFLVLVIVTDEDDCSAADPALFDPESTVYTEHPNLRCYLHGVEDGALHPISRFAEGLRALRLRAGERIGVALIAGVPPDLATEGDLSGFDAILADPRLDIRIDDTEPMLPQPSCEAEGLGRAHPPRRLVELTRQFAPDATAQSICQADLRPAIGALARLIGERPCDLDTD